MRWGNFSNIHKSYLKLTNLFLEFPIEYFFFLKRTLKQLEVELQTVVHCHVGTRN